MQKLTKQDVIDIRLRYANHELKDTVWEDFKDKIGKSGFNKVWNGSTWTEVKMEVYTKENRAFHTLVRNSHAGKGCGKRLTIDEIKEIRTRLLTEKKEDIYKDFQNKVGSRQIFNNICNYKTYKYITI